MRQQLRARVLLPVAVLGLLGVGFGAFAYGKPADAGAEDLQLAPRHSTLAPTAAKPKAKTKAKTAKPAAKKKATKRKAPAFSGNLVEAALRSDDVVVVVFYSPQDDVDALAVREARAGAGAVDSGFLAVDVTSNRAVAKLATQYEVLESPAVLVFARGPRVAAQFGRYVDRATVAQAAENAGA